VTTEAVVASSPSVGVLVALAKEQRHAVTASALWRSQTPTVGAGRETD
jgi:hypothetical protein